VPYYVKVIILYEYIVDENGSDDLISTIIVSAIIGFMTYFNNSNFNNAWSIKQKDRFR
jgi:hypothetical protein